MILARNGNEVHLVARDKQIAEQLGKTRENLEYLPGFALPENVHVTNEIPEAELGVLALPSAAVRENCHLFQSFSTVCVASKGLDPSTGKTLGEVLEEACPQTAIAAISGPNLAVELARGIPTAAVCACQDQEIALAIRNAFNGSTYRVYISDDRKGVELAGSLKNVIAIGAGISDGVGFGDNTKGAFVARGLSEMTKLGLAMGAKLQTFLGLAGVGDLFATASSRLSRNYRVGFAIGQGTPLEEAVASLGQVAEGVPTTRVALDIAKSLGIDVPLISTLFAVMHAQVPVQAGIEMLMERETLREHTQ